MTAHMTADAVPALVAAAVALSAGVPPFPPEYVCVLISIGGGSFLAPQLFTAAGPRGIAIADLNVDGVPDVVTANMNGNVGRYLGTGGGSLGAPATTFSG